MNKTIIIFNNNNFKCNIIAILFLIKLDIINVTVFYFFLLRLYYTRFCNTNQQKIVRILLFYYWCR